MDVNRAENCDMYNLIRTNNRSAEANYCGSDEMVGTITI
jgi:hypothetical protein